MPIFSIEKVMFGICIVRLSYDQLRNNSELSFRAYELRKVKFKKAEQIRSTSRKYKGNPFH